MYIVDYAAIVLTRMPWVWVWDLIRGFSSTIDLWCAGSEGCP